MSVGEALLLQPLEQALWPLGDRTCGGATDPEPVTDAIVNMQLGIRPGTSQREIQLCEPLRYLWVVRGPAQQEGRRRVRGEGHALRDSRIEQRLESGTRADALDRIG